VGPGTECRGIGIGLALLGFGDGSLEASDRGDAAGPPWDAQEFAEPRMPMGNRRVAHPYSGSHNGESFTGKESAP
jgi:hypothetical protein